MPVTAAATYARSTFDMGLLLACHFCRSFALEFATFAAGLMILFVMAKQGTSLVMRLMTCSNKMVSRYSMHVECFDAARLALWLPCSS